MRAAMVAIAAIALSGCTTLRTYWAEKTPAQRVVIVGLIGFGVYTGHGMFFGSRAANRQCVSGTPIECAPEANAPAGTRCTCL